MNDVTLTPPPAALVNSAANLPGYGAAGNPAFGGLGNQFARMRLFLAQPAVARTLPLLGLVALVAAAALLWMILSAPNQRMLSERMADADKAAVAQLLDSSGIAYSFAADTGALMVDETQYHAARMALASAGLPKSAPDADSMLANLPMGASRAVEGEKLRMAREMDLARTIEAIDAVESARVHLALDAPSAFIRNRNTPTASVMIKLAGGQAIGEGQVRAIVHLVAASVPGMAAQAVSVVDQNGKLLSSDGENSAASQQSRIQNDVEGRYRQALASLLTPVLGAGNFIAEVSADLLFDEKQATRETYPADDSRVAREQGSWSADNALASGGGYGVPGAISNQVPPAAVPSTTPQAIPPISGEAVTATDPKRTSETFSRDFQLGREISVTRNATGTVRRISVAVALRNTNPKKPRSAAEIATIENLVKSAVGFDATRGDQVAITARNFADTKLPESSITDAPWMSSLIRNGSALLVILVLLFGIGRPLLKRRSAARAKSDAEAAEIRTALGQDISNALAQTIPLDPDQPISLDMISRAPSYAQRAQMVRQFVRQNPDHAALVVRDLLADTGAKS